MKVRIDGVAEPLSAGSNAIGKLSANSGVDIGDVDVLSAPTDPFGLNADAIVTAGATGSIQAKLRRLTNDLDALKTSLETRETISSVNEVFYSGTKYTIQSVLKNATTAETEIVSPTSGTKIVVLQTFLVNQGTTIVTAKLQKDDTVTPVDITPTIDLPLDGGGGYAWMISEGDLNDEINLVLTGSGFAVGLYMTYIEV